MDRIANLLSQLKNASLARKEFIEIPYSKALEAILKVIEDGGFVKKVKVFKEKDTPYKSLHIDLAYLENGEPMIRTTKRVSKSGGRMYVPSKEIKRVKSKFGLVVVSTSKGVMAGEKAVKSKLGGEVICEIQ